MTIDALSIIEQFESGGRNIHQEVPGATNSSASGYWQITNSTWNSDIVPATGLPRVGPGTANPHGVMDLTEAQQRQGATALFEARGFQPWTCQGCNAALREYVANHGGAGAFSINGDPVNGGGGGNGGSEGGPDLSFTVEEGAQSALPPVNAQPGELAQPFTWAYRNVIVSTQQAVSNDIHQLQTAVGTYLPSLLVLALVALGIRSLFGRFLIDRYAKFLLTVCWVVPFVAVGSSFYQKFIVDPVMNFPIWWQQFLIGNNGTGVQLVGASPAGMLDWVYNYTNSVGQSIWSATPVSLSMFEVGLGIWVAKAIIGISLAALFASYAILTLLSLIMLIIGPICIPFALFTVTAFVFRGWIWATATLVLSMLAIDIILSLFLALMTNLMQTLAITGTPNNDIQSFWGAAIVMFLFGLSVYYVPRLVERIGSGVGVGLDYASYHMSGGPIHSTAMRVLTAPSNMVRRFTGL